jgi:hypothetical protein
VNGGKLNVQHHKFKKNLGLQSLILNLIGKVVDLLVSDPRTYKQAMNSPDVVHWKMAMLEEINALLQNGTWDIVRLPEGEKAIGSGWVFKIK